MNENNINLKLWLWVFMVWSLILFTGSLHDISYESEDFLNPTPTAVRNMYIPNQTGHLISENSAYQGNELSESERESEGEICDPADRECACLFSFIPREYGIFVATIMLIAVIVSIVLYDILHHSTSQ
ncbi:MAG: hypothetical protein HXS47_08270 [Theionarchaea archaeon]|nr:hypothetical protein [Theionarchaea archaeon]